MRGLCTFNSGPVTLGPGTDRRWSGYDCTQLIRVSGREGREEAPGGFRDLSYLLWSGCFLVLEGGRVERGLDLQCVDAKALAPARFPPE